LNEPNWTFLVQFESRPNQLSTTEFEGWIHSIFALYYAMPNNLLKDPPCEFNCVFGAVSVLETIKSLSLNFFCREEVIILNTIFTHKLLIEINEPPSGNIQDQSNTLFSHVSKSQNVNITSSDASIL
jgi:hypothetical protein